MVAVRLAEGVVCTTGQNSSFSTFQKQSRYCSTSVSATHIPCIAKCKLESGTAPEIIHSKVMFCKIGNLSFDVMH